MQNVYLPWYTRRAWVWEPMPRRWPQGRFGHRGERFASRRQIPCRCKRTRWRFGRRRAARFPGPFHRRKWAVLKWASWTRWLKLSIEVWFLPEGEGERGRARPEGHPGKKMLVFYTLQCRAALQFNLKSYPSISDSEKAEARIAALSCDFKKWFFFIQ